MTLFRGLSAFPLTPTDDHGVVDIAALGCLLDRLVTAKVDSIGLLGSTGGYAYLSRGERKRAIETARERVAGRIPFIVGVSALRTDEAENLARDAQTAGADALLLAPMSYTPLTDEEAYQHFVAVAGATNLPLCIYNNPSTTHFTFSNALLMRLAAVPNIRGVKMPLPKDMDFASELGCLRREESGLAVGYSGDWGAADALLAGADAWYSVVAGLLPEPALRLTWAAQAGEVDEVRRLNDRFRPLWDLFREFGSIRVMYAAASALFLSDAKPPRPILPIPDAHVARVDEAISGLVDL